MRTTPEPFSIRQMQREGISVRQPVGQSLKHSKGGGSWEAVRFLSTSLVKLSFATLGNILAFFLSKSKDITEVSTSYAEVPFLATHMSKINTRVFTGDIFL